MNSDLAVRRLAGEKTRRYWWGRE